MHRQENARGGRLVAVTGATGFIGGHLAAELARRGWRVRALVRSMPRWHGLAPAAAEAVLGDLADRRALAELVAGADAVVHLAGAIKGRSRADFVAANAEGTAALAAAWRDHAPDARFVHISSMAAREPSLSHYAASKLAAEERLREIAGEGRWHVLRPAAVYGPGDRETLRVFRAAAGPVQPMLNDGEARLTLVHVADLVQALAALIESDLPPGCHEVTDERTAGYRWDEIARAAACALERPCRPLRLPAPVIRALGLAGDALGLAGAVPMLTSQKAREVLFPDWRSAPERQLPPELWRPRVPLDEGFAETARWYRAAGWLRR
jgi:nucleoside-diphosphate-sugar epimerase